MLETEATQAPLVEAFFNPRQRSLIRGNVLVLGSLAWAFRLSNFPNNRATLLLMLPLLVCIAGTIDTVRCMQRKWSWYHGGVVLCVYMDLMALAMVVFLLIYPYTLWLSKSR